MFLVENKFEVVKTKGNSPEKGVLKVEFTLVMRKKNVLIMPASLWG